MLRRINLNWSLDCRRTPRLRAARHVTVTTVTKGASTIIIQGASEPALLSLTLTPIPSAHIPRWGRIPRRERAHESLAGSFGGPLAQMSLSALSKEDQEALRLLVQHVLRGFYEPKFTVAMDQLVRHTV